MASRENAQTAAPRTSGLSVARNCLTGAIIAESPLLPAAMRTLRMKRSRPMRLMAEPEKKLRNAASSSDSRKASGGDLRSSRACSFA